MKILERIDLLLEQKGITEKKRAGWLAKACGITVQSVYEWRTGGTKSIRPENIAKIAAALSTTADFLITGTDYKNLPRDKKIDLFKNELMTAIADLDKGEQIGCVLELIGSLQSLATSISKKS